MSNTASEWKNKKGTADRSCGCGSWKNHWINYSGNSWPSNCSVSGCTTSPELGAHVYNTSVEGEKIVPMCHSCNGLDGTFHLNGAVTLVRANKFETCS